MSEIVLRGSPQFWQKVVEKITSLRMDNLGLYILYAYVADVFASAEMTFTYLALHNCPVLNHIWCINKCEFPKGVVQPNVFAL